LLEVRRGGAHAVLQLGVESLQLLVQAFVLDLLPEIVQRGDYRDRLAALVHDLAGYYFAGKRSGCARIDQRETCLTRRVLREQEIGDERRELRIVAPHRRLLTARRSDLLV